MAPELNGWRAICSGCGILSEPHGAELDQMVGWRTEQLMGHVIGLSVPIVVGERHLCPVCASEAEE